MSFDEIAELLVKDLVKKEITFEEAEGKIVKIIIYNFSGQVVIVFTDKTFTTIIGTYGEYDLPATLNNGKFEESKFDDSQLIKMGIKTQEELDLARQERQKKLEKEQEIQDRRMYERLKEKLGE